MQFLMETAKTYGLFVALVCWVLYENKQRETRYLNVIETLTEEVKERLRVIEQKMTHRGEREKK